MRCDDTVKRDVHVEGGSNWKTLVLGIDGQRIGCATGQSQWYDKQELEKRGEKLDY